MRVLPLVEGMMPIQFFLELAIIFGVLTLGAYYAQKFGHRLNKLFQSVTAFAIVYWYLCYRLYPPLPFTIVATYLLGASIAIWGWVSSNEGYWEDFRRPFIHLMDGRTAVRRCVRAFILVLLPVLAASWTYHTLLPPDPSLNGPMDLRAYHPAPPGQIVVYPPEYFRR
jgi:hypothetical protein